MHSLGRSLPTYHRPLLLSFFFLLLFLLETTHAAMLPHMIPITRVRRLQESAFDININTPLFPPSLRIQIHENHHDNNNKLTKTKKSNTDNKMTKHGLLDLVTTNLGINLHTSSSSSSTSPESQSYGGPPPPKFHISSKYHFVHPLPGTYPRMARLSDGSILFAFTHFEENRPRGTPAQRSLKIARSLDGGKTFTPHGEVTTSQGDTDNLFMLQLPWTVPVGGVGCGYGNGNGETQQGQSQSQSQSLVQPILAAFRNHDFAPGGGNGTGYTHHRITICQSLDNGRRWEFLSQAVESSPPRGLWEPFMRMSKSRRNEIQLFYSGELGADDQDTFLTVSRDGGRSWSKPYAVTGVGHTAFLGGQGPQQGWNGKLRDGMIGIAETKDTKEREVLVMVLETTRVVGNFVVECLLSYDDGLTWGWRQSVYVPPAPLTRGRGGRRRNAGAPQVASFGDGEIAVVFMTDEDDDEVNDNRWPMGAKIKVLFGGRPDEQGRIIWREGGRPRDVSSSGTVLVEVGNGNGGDGAVGRSGSGSASSLAPAPAPGQDTSSLWPGVLRLDGEKVLVVYETGGIIKGRVITQSSP